MLQAAMGEVWSGNMLIHNDSDMSMIALESRLMSVADVGCTIKILEYDAVELDFVVRIEKVKGKMVTIKYLYNNMLEHSEIVSQDEANKKLRDNAMSWVDFTQNTKEFVNGVLMDVENTEVVTVEFKYNHHKVTVDGEVYQMIVTVN